MTELQPRIPVAVLGATGMVGQRFIELLQGHPWFELVALAASDSRGGRGYAEVAPWRLGGCEMPASVANLPVLACRPDALPAGVRIVFSALPGEVAGEIGLDFARAGKAVFSNARTYRMEADVPLLIPEVNAEHAAALLEQRKRGGWSGSIVTNANCSATPLVMALGPLQKVFGVRKVLVTTMLGTWQEGKGISLAPLVVSAHCNRVATREGHLECASVELARPASPEEIIAAWENAASEVQQLHLPSAPDRTLVYRREVDRPQTLLDRDAGRGMSVTLGRLRPCPILSYKFVLLGHNTIRGAAGGSMLNAELCVRKGYI
jgi:aspartate-semialdehyde dehydrogenase